MASSVKIKNNLPSFKRNLYNVLDDALADGSRDVLINAKNRAPFDKGGLRSQSESNQRMPLWWRVSFFVVYARFQEFGGDNNRKVENYTTSGTGKAFLKKSGDEQVVKIASTMKKHAARARA